MKVYPSWRYHKTHEPKIIQSEAEDRALESEGWVDSPAKVDAHEPKEMAPSAPKVSKKSKSKDGGQA